MKHLLAFLVWAGAAAWFHSADLQRLFSAWSTPDYTYCWALPPLAALLALGRWRRSPRCGCDPSPGPGYVCFAAALILWLMGRAGGMDNLVFASLWTGFLSAVLLSCGTRAVRNQGLSLLVLALALPLPLPLREALGGLSAGLSADLAAVSMRHLGVAVFRDGSLLDLGVLAINVPRACDGFRLMAPALVVALMAGFWMNRGFWSRALVVACAPALAVGVNGLRLAGAGSLARGVSIQSSLSFYHETSALPVHLLLLAAILGLSLALRLAANRRNRGDLDRFADNARSGLRTPPLNRDSVVHLLAAAALLAGGGLVFPALLEVRTQFDREPLDAFPRSVGAWNQDPAASPGQGARPGPGEEALSRVFVSPDGRDRIVVDLVYRTAQKSPLRLETALRPSLPGDWKALAGPWPAAREPGGFPAALALSGVEGRKVLVLAWLGGRGRLFDADWAYRLALAWDSLLLRRGDGVLVRLELPLRDGQSPAEAARTLDAFARDLKDLLPPFVPEP